MQYLFSPEGEAALAGHLRQAPLLAFDFDGTLAPIVQRPEEARISPVVALRLKALSMLLPVAIVTGRAVDDVRKRLGFDPDYVVGNHGADDGFDPLAAAAHALALNPLRERLQAHRSAMLSAGIQIEDKGQSIALHYRLAPEREHASAAIRKFLASADNSLRIFAGKLVVNVVAADAPDKRHAVQTLMIRSGANCVFFAGDDVNDESVFSSAPADWLTVRVGRDDPASGARFFVEDPDEMALLLKRMLMLIAPALD